MESHPSSPRKGRHGFPSTRHPSRSRSAPRPPRPRRSRPRGRGRPARPPRGGRRAPALPRRGLLLDVRLLHRGPALLEAQAYHRIQAARAARSYPAVLERIRRGEIHLSGVKLLAPHLTPENHVELLQRARHRSKRAIEEFLADRAPKPDAPPIVRQLPQARSCAGETEVELATSGPSASAPGARFEPAAGAAGPGALQDPVHGGPCASREAPGGAGAAAAPGPGRGSGGDLRTRPDTPGGGR